MRALATGCPGLRALFACGTSVTEECLAPLAELEQLTFKRNPSISPDGVAAKGLRALRPRMDLLKDRMKHSFDFLYSRKCALCTR